MEPMALRTDPRIRDLIPPLTDDEYRRLEASIREEGIREPIITWQPTVGGQPCIADGHNRYRIAREHGIGFEIMAMHWRTLEDCQKWVIDNQLARRNLSAFSRGQLGLRMLEIEKAAAKERQATSTGGADPHLRESFHTAEEGRACDKAAKAIGISGRQLDKVRFLDEHADDETKNRLREGDTTVHKEHTRIKGEQRKAAAINAVESKPQPLPDGPFDVLVVDPPWPYHLRPDDGSHRGNVPYAPMSVEDICALPVSDLAEKDAILWLWVTNAHLLDGSAHRVIENWGFDPKTLLTWAKPSIGAGHWLRGITEHVIMAVRGKPVHILTNQSTLLEAPRREHSRKPSEFYELVESLCPGSKVELFSREQRSGWTAWGSEKGKFDEHS